MAQTPRQPSDGADTGSKSRGAYLPVLPEGWEYTAVTLSGPDGKVEVLPATPGSGGVVDGYRVEIDPKGAENRRLDSPTLADAVRSAARAVKALTKMSKHQAEVDAARKALLDDLGTREPQPERPTPPPQREADDGKQPTTGR
jgi:hypothetical protein